MNNELAVFGVIGGPVATIILAIGIAGFSSIQITEAPMSGITVSSAEDLSQIQEYLGRGNSGVIFEINQDISLSEYLEDSEIGWVPIGNDLDPENRFYGSLHGNGYTISGLWLDAEHDWAGLFGALGNSGVICDLQLEINPEKGGVTGNAIAGGIVGSNYGTIRDCTVLSTGEAGVSGSDNVGGLAGYQNGGKVIGCHAQINVFATGGTTSCVGGLVGLSDYTSIVTKSSAAGNVYSDVDLAGNSIVGLGLDGDKVGGLVGMQDRSSDSTECYARGDVRSAGENDDVGGLIGRTYNTDLALMQYDGGTVDGCFSVGNVLATGTNLFVGGFIGNTCDGVISNSYSKGNLTVTGKHLYIGSFLGFLNRAEVVNCYTIGHIDVNEGSNNYIGGIIGYNFESTVTASFFNEESVGHFNGVGNDEGGAFAVDHDEMCTPSTFIIAGWNMSDIWGIYCSEDTGYGTPYLRGFFNNVLVTPVSMTVKYDGTTYDDPPEWTSNNRLIEIGGEPCYVDSEGNIVNPKDAGIYEITMGTLSVGEQYHLSFANNMFLVIEPAEIVINISSEQYTYGNEFPEKGVVNIPAPEQFYDGDILELIDQAELVYACKDRADTIYTAGNIVPAGTFDLILVGRVLSNYSVRFSGRLTVDPMTLSDNMVSGTREYDYAQLPERIEISVDNGDHTLVEDTDYVLSYPEHVLIGSNVARIRGVGNYTGSVYFEYVINATPAVRDVLNSIYSIPETIDKTGFEAVIRAYSLFLSLATNDRESLQQNDVEHLNVAVDKAKVSGHNATAGKVTVEDEMPWYVCIESDDILQGTEEWNAAAAIAWNHVDEQEHTILSAFAVLFTDKLNDVSWHPSDDARFFLDTSDLPATDILYVADDGVQVMEPSDSGYEILAAEQGVFIVIGEAGASEVPPIIVGVAALIIIGVTASYIVFKKGSSKETTYD